MQPDFESAVAEEFKRLLVLHGRTENATARGIQRLVIRSLRIGSGVWLWFMGWVIYEMLPSVGDTPFAQLTLTAVGGAAFAVFVAVLFAYWGWLAAFGAGPTEDPNTALWAEARATVTTRQSSQT